MEKWKAFFQTSGSDIWTVIDRAITIAVMDHPAGMRQRRDKFTEKMFCPTSHLAGLCECVEEPEDDDQHDDPDLNEDASADESDASGITRKQKLNLGLTTTQKNAGGRDNHQGQRQFKDVDEEMEQESRRMKEISMLKSRISNPDEPDDYLCVDLEALERMEISFEALKATGVGRPVNDLRKHPSSSVRAIVKRLIRKWKDMADEWAKSAEHVNAPGSPDGNDDVDDGYGLPSPPVDEDELLAAGSAPLEVKQLLDFMEDDLSAGSDLNESREVEPLKDDWVNGIYEEPEDEDVESPRPTKTSRRGKPEPVPERLKSRKDNTEINNNKNITRGRPVISSNNKSSSSIPSSSKLGTGKEQQKNLGATSRPKPSTGSTTSSLGLQRSKPMGSSMIQRRPGVDAYSAKSSKGFADDEPGKLAAAKRKLQENYQQAENAKKQRTVQVMELTELPKGKGGPKAASKTKPQHNNRYSKR